MNTRHFHIQPLQASHGSRIGNHLRHPGHLYRRDFDIRPWRIVARLYNAGQFQIKNGDPAQTGLFDAKFEHLLLSSRRQSQWPATRVASIRRTGP